MLRSAVCEGRHLRPLLPDISAWVCACGHSSGFRCSSVQQAHTSTSPEGLNKSLLVTEACCRRMRCHCGFAGLGCCQWEAHPYAISVQERGKLQVRWQGGPGSRLQGRRCCCGQVRNSCAASHATCERRATYTCSLPAGALCHALICSQGTTCRKAVTTQQLWRRSYSPLHSDRC